ncbi:hypothetical protein GF337_11650 [candidate division KSB1 bacterium]|nr:hypothetical protein [candidate division KSB1 bacterium]
MNYIKIYFIGISLIAFLFFSNCTSNLNPVSQESSTLTEPDRDTIVFSANDHQRTGWHISIHYDKNVTHRISEGPTDTAPAWLPDKRWIYFVRSDSQQVSRIWKMRYNGENKQPISPEIRDCRSMDISPIEERIAFSAEVDGESHIFICDYDGSNLRQLTTGNLISATGAVNYFHPTWHWDEQSILIEYRLIDDNKSGVANIDPNGTLIRTYPEIEDLKPSHPKWSPTSDEFVFVSNSDSLSYIYRINGNGTDLVKLTDEHSSSEPDWSFNGNRIIYVLHQGDALNYVMSMNRDSSDKKFLIVSSAQISNPDW